MKPFSLKGGGNKKMSMRGQQTLNNGNIFFICDPLYLESQLLNVCRRDL